jgi:hypothetical protein
MRAIDDRRSPLLESLERSGHEEGFSRQHSGFGALSTSTGSTNELRRNHLTRIYDDEDSEFSGMLVNSVANTFPVKRIHHLCGQFETVWRKSRFVGSRGKFNSPDDETNRGPFPYVDEKATVLGELTRLEILKTRHRVNSNSHPVWAIRTLRRRRRKHLLKLKKRSISQERIRTLQAKLISNKSVSPSANT